MLTNTFTCVLVAAATLWYWSSSLTRLPDVAVWDLLQHLMLGWAAPTVLIYLWESEDRLRFMQALQQQQHNKLGPVDAAQLRKCKDL